ncbi:ABC transporter permease, partial [Chloroflexota bacterium]
MSLARTLKVAWEGLTLNKVRSFLTTLGVIIGVAAVIIMLAVSAGAEAEIADQINSLGANLVMVMPSFQQRGFGQGRGRPPALAYDDIEGIAENVTGINGVSAEQSTTQDVKVGNTALEGVSIVGTTSGFPDVRDYEVTHGRFLTDDDNDRANKVVALGYDVAEELFGDAGSAPGQKVKIGSTQFTVVGVMGLKGVVGTTDYDGRLYIPLTVFFKKFTNARFGGDSVRLIYVSAENRDMMDSVTSQVSN